RKRSRAGGTAPQDRATAGARCRHLGLGVLEPAHGAPTGEAEGRPVAEYVPALLAEPIGRLAHTVRVPARLRFPRFPPSNRGVQWRSRALPSRPARCRM